MTGQEPEFCLPLFLIQKYLLELKSFLLLCSHYLFKVFISIHHSAKYVMYYILYNAFVYCMLHYVFYILHILQLA